MRPIRILILVACALLALAAWYAWRLATPPLPETTIQRAKEFARNLESPPRIYQYDNRPAIDSWPNQEGSARGEWVNNWSAGGEATATLARPPTEMWPGLWPPT